MQNVLVTGGCGFIGSNFVRLALERLFDARIAYSGPNCATHSGPK